MARKPIPQQDAGVWGEILNEFLAVTLQSDGTLKEGAVTASAIIDGTVSEAKLDTALANKVNNGGVADASSSVKGVVQLTGDLGGTAAAPTVPGLAAKANSTDVYTQSQVDTALNNKANSVHTHTASSITDFSTAADTRADGRIAASSLNALADVSTAGATNGQVLKFNGTSWNPAADNDSGGGGGVPATYALGRVVYDAGWPIARPSGYAYIDWAKSSPTDPDPDTALLVPGDTITEWS